MPSSARMSAAVLPATKAPNVSTRRSASSDKADLTPGGELLGAVAELVDVHVGRMRASGGGNERGRVERRISADRGAGDVARPELRDGQRAERGAVIAPQ